MLVKLRVSEMRATPPKEQRRALVLRAINEIIVYVIYLTTTLLLAVATRDDTMCSLHQVMHKHFVNRPIISPHEQTNTYNDIVTPEEWWDYIEQVFLESLHEGDNNDEPTKFILEENLLLGPPRLRQKRVRPNTCKIHDHFENFFAECYGPFTAENEEKSAYYKGTKFTQPTNYDVLHIGKYTQLTDGGYVQDLTYDAEENKKIFAQLKEEDWLDRGTRLIVLEFACFNDNTKLFDNFKLAAELPSIGGVLTEVHHEVIDLYTIWTKPDNYFAWITCSIFYCCLVYYAFEESNELIRSGWSYFFSFWNYVDLSVLILCIYCTVYHFWHASFVNKLVNQFADNPDKYLNIDELAYYYSTYLTVYSFCVCLQCFRLFKYFNFNPNMLQLLVTLKRCGLDILGFFLMFLIIFLAYALVGMLMFGSYHFEFKDVKQSLLTVVKMIVGQFDYDDLEETSRYVAPVFCVSYVIVVFFILMNMFLAILADTFLRMKQEMRLGELDLTSFLTKSLAGWWNNIKHRLKKIKQGQYEADGMDDDEIREFGYMRTYFDIIGPHTNLEYNAMQARDLGVHIKRLQRRMLAVEFSMQELLERLDIILEESAAIKKEK